MKKTGFILAALLLAAAGFFLWTLLSFTDKQTPASNNAEPQNSAAIAVQYEAKSDSQGGVEIEIRPLNLGSSTWTFDFGINTHSGSLDADILKIVSLTDDRGDTFIPTAWNGPGPGGHHRDGALAFAPITPQPSSITVIVRDVGGVPERKFTWQLK